MLTGSGLAILLLLATSNERSAGLQVDCGSLGLREAPPLPEDTTELHLQDNQLTTVPQGHFDRLDGLRRVTLTGNPFHCDCGIQYLRSWLRENKDIVSGVPTCASPSAVTNTAIAALSDAHFSSCGQRRCAEGLYTERLYNSLVGLMVCGLIGLLLWGLRLAKRSAFILNISERAESPRALKLKTRKTL